ncbi:MAG: winged helix-turn-helix domain-containing protein [Candidatus Aenigmatarchaeota archaeon]
MKEQHSRAKILEVLNEAYPRDLSIGEVAKRAKVSRSTASMWLRVLVAERRIEVSRKVGNAIFYRLRKS